MIVIDTSAIVAVMYREPMADKLLACLAREPRRSISAGTLAEFMVVAAGRQLISDANAMIAALAAEVVPVNADMALAVGEAYRRFGRGQHPANLNFGDCFAYALAKGRGLPLLYVGQDFAQTDVASALA